MLKESYNPTAGMQTDSFGVGRISTHNNISFNKIKAVFRFLGPAFIVSVAYIDPGILKLEHVL